ncbi:MAG: hypothetical protein JKY65_11280 [Planctomycetes bacterium]|nr:hypothetical protein [Planctomycetota bacterium]
MSDLADRETEPAPPDPSSPDPEAEAREGVPPEPVRLEGDELRAATLAAVALRPGAKLRAGGVALTLLGGLSTAFAGLGLTFLYSGQGARALGVFLGHSAAQLLTISWLLGAILTFDRENDDFIRATLGASPLRFVVMGTIVGLGIWLSDPDESALFFSLMASYVAGHFVEAVVLGRLSDERLVVTQA